MRIPRLGMAVCFGILSAATAQPGGAAQPAAQAEQRTLKVDDYLDWEDVQSPALSPDGKQVIYGRRWVDKMNDRWQTSLWIMNVDGSRNRFLVNGSDARWSPDGTRIAYTATGEPSGTQIFVRWMDAEGAVTQLTRLTESPGGIRWSPDGKWIAFSMFVPRRESWSIPMPSAPRGATWTPAPRIVQKLNYRRDGSGFVEEGNTHLFVVGADGGGTPRQLSSGDFNHTAPRWTPDGAALLFSGLRVAEAEYQWRESEVYSLDFASGAIRQLTRRKGPDANPTPSPDGKLIAYTGYDSTDATWIDSKLYVMNADGSSPRVISGNMDRSPQGLMWAPDNSGVYFNAESEGSRNLYFAPVGGGGQVRRITTGAQVLTVADISDGGIAVGVMATATRPNDIVSFSIANPQPRWLTTVNDDILFGKQLGTTEELWYTSVDGLRIQGWIVKPPNFDRAKKYPLILEIHGGPHSMYNLSFNFGRQTQVADGYVVLYANPRGSTGYGSAFGNAIKNAYPGKDYDDLMAGVDTVINRGFIDPQNLFVWGCSGGGVLTAWIVGHTSRFAAASSNCPVINWMSFVGTTDGSSWYRNFEKLPWEDPAEHLKRSPLMYVGNVTTPTMLMTGVNDLRTPISQTEEFYEALKLRKIPTAMVRFNDEWHGTSSKPSNWMRTQLYLRSWFQRWARKGVM